MDGRGRTKDRTRKWGGAMGRSRTDGRTDGRTGGSPDITPPLECGVPTHESDLGVAPPERERVESGRGDPARGVRVAAVVGINGVLGEDVGVLYPFIVFRAVAFPPHHVPEAAITDLRFQDLLDLPLNVAVRLEDGRGFVVPRASGKRIRFRELKFHHREDRVELGVPRGKLELVCTLSDGLHDFEGAEAFVREFDGRTGHLDVGGVQPDSVAYFDLRGGRVSAIVVQLELVLGFNECSFGFRDSGRDPVSELVDSTVERNSLDGKRWKLQVLSQ